MIGFLDLPMYLSCRLLTYIMCILCEENFTGWKIITALKGHNHVSKYWIICMYPRIQNRALFAENKFTLKQFPFSTYWILHLKWHQPAKSARLNRIISTTMPAAVVGPHESDYSAAVVDAWIMCDPYCWAAGAQRVRRRRLMFIAGE